MQGKIAVEEHFRIAETTGSEGRYPGPYWAGLSAKLLDIHDTRLAEMDNTGIEIEVISLNSNAVQGIPDLAKAVEEVGRAKLLRADAVEWRQRPVQDVIHAVVAARFLNCRDVRRLLHHAHG